MEIIHCECGERFPAIRSSGEPTTACPVCARPVQAGNQALSNDQLPRERPLQNETNSVDPAVHHADADTPASAGEPYVVPQVIPERDAARTITGWEAYNVVTDVVIGPNLRWRDNLFQAVAIMLCLILGVAIGVAVARPDVLEGGLVGGAVGLLVGLFGSGIVLMIYRLFKH